ncbi:long-chain fatty acid transporter fat1 [Conoideocrella luteorostrata]|uniref:Very long-chain fatty acid transport protein n=1 Tax=Conoideocrella luteorostrata TaxID=1105319 RepID=A0AAJ0CLV3_9HYPO|nr:long-chain fatty acid transporter fat1 [Conoideocrella luteorostrata]
MRRTVDTQCVDDLLHQSADAHCNREITLNPPRSIVWGAVLDLEVLALSTPKRSDNPRLPFGLFQTIHTSVSRHAAKYYCHLPYRLSQAPLTSTPFKASTGLLAVAGGVAATTAYLDAKLHVRKDLSVLSRTKQGEKNLSSALKAKKASGYFLFEAAAHRQPNEQCVWSREGTYTWAQAYQRVSQYGHYFQDLGVQPLEYVGVYLYNSPDFVFIWLALLSIGAAPALINYNLASAALLHCVKISGTRLLIFDSASDCVSRISASDKELRDLGVQPILLDDGLKGKIDQYPTSRPGTACFDDSSRMLPFALMYTSGTTGLPKAAPLGIHRNYAAASTSPKSFGQKPGPGGDRTYFCIPMYHGTGGLAVMNDLMGGQSIAVAPKFSLSRFWQDCIDSKSTIFVYVGELVRYLLSAPSSSNDRKHQIRLVWGNGLSPELWSRFQERFGISEIGEFYSSTEGVMILVKFYRSGYGTGAIGHHGWLLRRQYHEQIMPVKIDAETGDIWRSPDTGFAKRLPYEQGGEILVKLASRQAWAGYYGADEATKKKLIENVFEKGDLFYRTGDALRRDADGHWFFMDRLGDTYRWKGENVSTTEVTQVLGTHPSIAEANVYGVKIPSHDGRAGCAAIALNDGNADTFDWSSVATLLRKELPPYAVPVFLRVREGVGSMATDNHKHNKVHLRDEGVDPRALGTRVPDGKRDRLFWLPTGSAKYVAFTQGDWDKLTQLRARI